MLDMWVYYKYIFIIKLENTESINEYLLLFY